MYLLLSHPAAGQGMKESRDSRGRGGEVGTSPVCAAWSTVCVRCPPYRQSEGLVGSLLDVAGRGGRKDVVRFLLAHAPPMINEVSSIGSIAP
jgi:hypothetical protein